MSAGRVIVVTGASGGIGLEVVRRFAAAGDRVVAGVRSAERANDIRDDAGAAGADVEVMDVTDDDSVSRAIDAIVGRHGPVDVLVANAGTGAVGTLEELTVQSIRATMEVNFFGVVRATKAVLPSMRRRGGGRLVAVTSVGGVIGQPFTDAYCSAKFAVEGLYESLRPVVARFGVHVSIVEPGPVATEFQNKSVGISREGLDVDGDPYGSLWSLQEAVASAGESRRQAVGDAAQVIVDVVDADEPALRYQTSAFTQRLLGMKLADMDGSAITGFTSRWLDPPDPAPHSEL